MRLRIKKQFIGLGVSGLVSLQALAGTMGPVMADEHPWSVTGSLGYTEFSDLYQEDGQTAVGRFAIGRNLYTGQRMMFGLEVGVQSGNDMRLSAADATLFVLGGLPLDSTVKPMLDALVTLQIPVTSAPVFIDLKGGLAFRRWQFNEGAAVNSRSDVAGEVQAGLGYQINERASLTLVYQGIYGESPHLTVDVFNETGHVSNIPVQNGVLLGMTITV